MRPFASHASLAFNASALVRYSAVKCECQRTVAIFVLRLKNWTNRPIHLGTATTINLWIHAVLQHFAWEIKRFLWRVRYASTIRNCV
jgi:hypothetical protein